MILFNIPVADFSADSTDGMFTLRPRDSYGHQELTLDWGVGGKVQLCKLLVFLVLVF